MKVLFLVAFVCVFVFGSNAQITDTVIVEYTKSAYLVFPSENVGFDCGSEDVIVRVAGNKLILQAGVENFEETNLFVEVDGVMYMFIVQYGVTSKRYLYDYASSKLVSGGGTTETIGDVLVVNDEDKDSIMAEYARVADVMMETPDEILNRGVVKYKLGIYLRDIVIYDDKMFLEFEVINKGNIAYDVDFYQYRVKSVKRKIKGESFQEIIMDPILEHRRPDRFEGQETVRYVIVLDKFVLTENKKLVVEHWEDNGQDMSIEGGRKVDFDIFSRDILNVRTISM